MDIQVPALQFERLEAQPRSHDLFFAHFKGTAVSTKSQRLPTALASQRDLEISKVIHLARVWQKLFEGIFVPVIQVSRKVDSLLDRDFESDDKFTRATVARETTGKPVSANGIFGSPLLHHYSSVYYL